MSVKKNQENKKLENKKLDKKTFKRINDKFRQYWKYLFWLIATYIVCYAVWSILLRKGARELARDEGWNGNSVFFVIILALLQGLLFALDGWVTALLKSPFNQMCFTINKSEGIPDEKKDYMITKATESNEHCKETLKKFGILMITAELAKTFFIYKNEKDGPGNKTHYGQFMIISYLVPLVFAAIDIWIIHRELKKIKKTVNSLPSGK